VISPDVLSTTTYGYQTGYSYCLALEATEVQMTLCPKNLGMSQVTTQVSEFLRNQKFWMPWSQVALASELPEMVQYKYVMNNTAVVPPYSHCQYLATWQVHFSSQ
jgi:hypothetical protein